MGDWRLGLSKQRARRGGNQAANGAIAASGPAAEPLP